MRKIPRQSQGFIVIQGVVFFYAPNCPVQDDPLFNSGSCVHRCGTICMGLTVGDRLNYACKFDEHSPPERNSPFSKRLADSIAGL
jgi:hypothetical protein